MKRGRLSTVPIMPPGFDEQSTGGIIYELGREALISGSFTVSSKVFVKNASGSGLARTRVYFRIKIASGGGQSRGKVFKKRQKNLYERRHLAFAYALPEENRKKKYSSWI